jgi:hypothetical protein
MKPEELAIVGLVGPFGTPKFGILGVDTRPN